MDHRTSRRAVLSTLAIAAATPVLLANGAAAARSIDPRWTALVADYHATRAEWEGTIGLGRIDIQDSQAG